MQIKKTSEPYIATYLHSKGKRLGLPIAGNFELTARCNFNCPMCYVHLTEEQIAARGKELTASQWLSIAQQARDQGMIFALLTGGEALVRKDFFEIYSGMKEMGLLISINSNGSLLSGEILEKFLKDPPFRFNITLYGGSTETYASMCGKPAFAQVVQNIRALRDAGVDVNLNLSITPYNVQDLDKIDAISKELDVHVKATSYMYPQVRINEQFGCGNRLTPEEAADAIVHWERIRWPREMLDRRACDLKALIPVDEPECPVESDTGVQCRAGRTSFWMTWDGKMLPCGMLPEPAAYPLEVGFEAAWSQIREKTKEIRLPGKCAVCPKKPVWPVCAAVCMTETGRFDQVPEYLCRQTDATIEKSWAAYLERNGNQNGN